MIHNAILLAYVSLFAFGLGDNIRGPLFSEILNEFGLSDSSGSWIFALSSLFGFVSSFASARLGARIGFQKLLQISLFILCLALVIFSSAQNLLQLLVAAACFGLSIGSLGFCQNALVVFGTNPHNRQQWLSGLHAMYALSSLLAPSLVALFAHFELNWRLSFLAASSFPFLAFLVSYMIPLPRSDRHLSPQKADIVQEPQGAGPHRSLQYLAGGFFALYVVAEIMVSSRLGLFFRRELAESLDQASLRVAYFFALMLLGRGVFSLYRPPFPLVYSLAFSLFLSALFLILGLSGWPWFLVFTGLTMAPFYSLAITYLAVLFRSEANRAIATAMAMQSICVVAMHLGIGTLSDQLSLSKALWLGPIVLLCALFFLWRTHELQKG